MHRLRQRNRVPVGYHAGLEMAKRIRAVRYLGAAVSCLYAHAHGPLTPRARTQNARQR